MDNIMIKLISSDGKEYFVSQRVAFMSELIKQLFTSNSEAAGEITIPDCEGAILTKVIEFCIFCTSILISR